MTDQERCDLIEWLKEEVIRLTAGLEPRKQPKEK